MRFFFGTDGAIRVERWGRARECGVGGRAVAVGVGIGEGVRVWGLGLGRESPPLLSSEVLALGSTVSFFTFTVEN